MLRNIHQANLCQRITLRTLILTLTLVLPNPNPNFNPSIDLWAKRDACWTDSDGRGSA